MLAKTSALVLAVAGVAGMCGPARAGSAEAPAEPAGVVFVVGGIGGLDLVGTSAQWALPRAGVPHEVRPFLWTHGRGHYLRDLQDVRYLLLRADQLAAEVRQVK